MKKVRVTVTVESTLKEESDIILRKMGWTPSQAYKLFLMYICTNKKIPLVNGKYIYSDGGLDEGTEE